jgi:multiple sugar transport system ATP-binding protein
MGRAIVRSPQVFLFDEPLSNLDAKLRVQMRKEIKELHQRLKTTTVYVTHDQVEAMTMADKIVVMQGGNVEQIGTPLELYDQPNNTFVATFIGSPSMNLMNGTYKRAGDIFVTETGEEIALGFTPQARDGQAVVLGTRPEHLLLSESGLKAKVVVTEPTGHETMIFLRYGETELVSVLTERHEFEPGQDVTISPRLDKLHLFDEATGTALRSA